MSDEIKPDLEYHMRVLKERIEAALSEYHQAVNIPVDVDINRNTMTLFADDAIHHYTVKVKAEIS